MDLFVHCSFSKHSLRACPLPCGVPGVWDTLINKNEMVSVLTRLTPWGITDESLGGVTGFMAKLADRVGP